MPDSSQSSPDPSCQDARSANLRKRKFYVRSGISSWTVLADDAETAALRFVQITLGDCLIPGTRPVTKQLQLLDVATMKVLAAAKLASRILISESGFTNSQAGEFVTDLVIKRWQKQIAALENLIRKTSQQAQF